MYNTYHKCSNILYFNRNAPCNDAYSFCGLRDQKYPDKRAMGYPFDRNTRFTANQDVDKLTTFVQQLPNAAIGECTIQFSNSLVNRSN